MQFAGISLAVGIAEALDDDTAGVDGFVEIAACLIIVGLLLIVFAKIDRIIASRMSPVDRMIWRRAFGRKAWR